MQLLRPHPRGFSPDVRVLAIIFYRVFSDQIRSCKLDVAILPITPESPECGILADPIQVVTDTHEPLRTSETMSEEESGRMVTSEYWDGRYAEVASDNQVHEWFKSFADIEPFLEENFMRHRGPDTPTKILHLGSGDSVRAWTSRKISSKGAT